MKKSVAVSAMCVVLMMSGSAHAQLGDFLNALGKAAQEAKKPQPRTQAPDTKTQSVTPSTDSAAAKATELTDAEWSDLYDNSENPRYLRRYEGRLVRVQGEISYTDGQYVIGVEESETVGAFYWCKTRVGSLPSEGMVTVIGAMTSPYVEAGEDGSAVYLKECRLSGSKQAVATQAPASPVKANTSSLKLDQALIGKKDAFCKRSFCTGTYTKASRLNTSAASVTLAEIKADAVDNCFEGALYSGEEETPRLRARCQRANPNPSNTLEVSANCPTGALFINGSAGFSQQFTFRGLNPKWRRGSANVDRNGNAYTKYIIWNVKENMVEQSSMVSYYDEAINFYSKLCPSYVPDWRVDGAGIPET